MATTDHGQKWADVLRRYNVQVSEVSPKLEDLLRSMNARAQEHLAHNVPTSDTAITSRKWVGPVLFGEESILRYSPSAITNAGYVAIARSTTGSVLLMSCLDTNFFRCRWMDSGFYYCSRRFSAFYLSDFCGFPWTVIRKYMTDYDYVEDRQIDSMNMP